MGRRTRENYITFYYGFMLTVQVDSPLFLGINVTLLRGRPGYETCFPFCNVILSEQCTLNDIITGFLYVYTRNRLHSVFWTSLALWALITILNNITTKNGFIRMIPPFNTLYYFSRKAFSQLYKINIVLLSLFLSLSFYQQDNPFLRRWSNNRSLVVVC